MTSTVDMAMAKTAADGSVTLTLVVDGRFVTYRLTVERAVRLVAKLVAATART